FALAAGAVRVGAENDKAHLCEQLVANTAAGPGVADRWRVRTAISHEPDGIFLRWIEVGRQQEAAFERDATLGRNLDELVVAAAVFFERVNGVGIECANERAVGGAEVHLCWPRVVAV